MVAPFDFPEIFKEKYITFCQLTGTSISFFYSGFDKTFSINSYKTNAAGPIISYEQVSKRARTFLSVKVGLIAFNQSSILWYLMSHNDLFISSFATDTFSF